MADFADQGGEGQEQTPRGARYQPYPQRAAASSNWRTSDNSPRPEAQTRGNRQSGSYNSPRPSYGQARETSDTRLYVGNLLYTASKDDIAQFFNDNGFNIANISMNIDPETGRNPSYCFVDFETADESQRAIAELNGKDVLGRTVRINPGMSRKTGEGPSQGQYASPGPRQYSSPRGWGGREGQQDGGRQSFNQYRDNQEIQAPSKRLYIGNLPAIEPQEAAESTMQSMFSSIGVEITNVSKLIAPHESKKDLEGHHHFIFVDLARAEDAEVAIEALDGKPADGIGSDVILRVNKAREQDRRRQGSGFGQAGFQSRRTDGPRDWRPRNEAER